MVMAMMISSRAGGRSRGGPPRPVRLRRRRPPAAAPPSLARRVRLPGGPQGKAASSPRKAVGAHTRQAGTVFATKGSGSTHGSVFATKGSGSTNGSVLATEGSGSTHEAEMQRLGRERQREHKHGGRAASHRRLRAAALWLAALTSGPTARLTIWPTRLSAYSCSVGSP